MTELIYHRNDESSGKGSPFEAAILGMASSKSLKIACPYLNHRRLSRILEPHADWKLLTDVEALFRSVGNAERLSFIKLFRDNQSRVRHNKNLHAKVIIADRQALVGSASLTTMGFDERAEMSVLLTDQQIVDELSRRWFDAIFNKCSEFTQEHFDEMQRFATQDLPDEAAGAQEQGTLSLPPGPKVQFNSGIVTLTNEEMIQAGLQRPAASVTDAANYTDDPKELAKRIVGEAQFARLANAPHNRLKKLMDALTLQPSIEIEATVDGRLQRFRIFKQAAAILHILRLESGRGLTKEKGNKNLVSEMKRLGYGERNTNHYCWALKGLGLVKIDENPPYLHAATAQGRQAVLPSEDTLKKTRRANKKPGQDG